MKEQSFSQKAITGPDPHEWEKSVQLKILGWVLATAGTILWIYGYLNVGHPSLVAWANYTPWWIADFLPNAESEIAVALMFISMVPMYWPTNEQRVIE